jgi:hypothetical protein
VQVLPRSALASARWHRGSGGRKNRLTILPRVIF